MQGNIIATTIIADPEPQAIRSPAYCQRAV